MMTQDEKIDVIYKTLVGNPELRQKGLIERIEDLETKAENDKQLRNKITGGVLVLSFVGSGAIAFFGWLIEKIWH